MTNWITRPFQSPDTDSLPPRIREAILRHQGRSEILIGWVQLGVVTVFATLYFVAPTPAVDGLRFDLVPYILAAYMVFTIVRLISAHRGPLAPWILGSSVVVDMSLLMTTIWSFHLKYVQPPEFYLKAPTLLYVFIFIALRALRFEARYVLLAGATAAVGWLVLAAYAAYAGGEVTRSFVHYMTGNAILLGAEFDKVISIIVVTLILAVAIARARNLLIGSVVKESEARELSRFFDEDIARRITESEVEFRPGQAVSREAAIMFVDIRGFTRHAADLDPGELIALLADYRCRTVPVIQAAGGSVDKFMGDGIMAVFGATRPSATAAADALRAVDALAADAIEWNEQRRSECRFAVRIGAAVTAGRILFGVLGDESRLEYTVIGDPVNIAAKLEKQNKAEDTIALTDLATYELAKAQGYKPPMDHEVRKGRTVEGAAGLRDLVVLAGGTRTGAAPNP